jgi:hypothetical protein
MNLDQEVFVRPMRIRGFPVTHSRLSHKLSALAHKRNLRGKASIFTGSLRHG